MKKEKMQTKIHLNKKNLNSLYIQKVGTIFSNLPT